MKRRIWRAPSPAFVLASIALFAALSGGAYAAATIGSGNIKRGAVTNSKIRNRAVTVRKLASSARTAGYTKNESTQIALPATATTTVGTLSLPRGSNYIVTAAVSIGGNGATNNPVTCTLTDDGAPLTTGAGFTNLAAFQSNVTVTAATNGGGSIVYACQPSAGSQAKSRVITATRVASVRR